MVKKAEQASDHTFGLWRPLYIALMYEREITLKTGGLLRALVDGVFVFRLNQQALLDRAKALRVTQHKNKVAIQMLVELARM